MFLQCFDKHNSTSSPLRLFHSPIDYPRSTTMCYAKNTTLACGHRSAEHSGTERCEKYRNGIACGGVKLISSTMPGAICLACREQDDAIRKKDKKPTKWPGVLDTEW
ncbi:hypothetical protein BDY17DRAFT_313411 [Neohortaea acidophila]|uniref:Uncharacterized protein n=1 Tax=Neohortaea acidophila TaxID=245834 RepID=A0A6A6PHW7_9PEZI|nr:uncharacterized protein BDY17DRAFT_313411 [Neohortaea acidophila]KAF2479638.1 hypothetical protein BDY17DRAFT_313411 [Neohortaea acidophila]